MPLTHTARETTNSIWTHTSESEFLSSVDTLHRRQQVAGQCSPHDRGRRRDDADHGRSFDIKIEQQLTEDLAFIAATEPGARAVTAVTVEEEGQNLTVNFAANSGVQTSTRCEVQKLFSLLAECARRDVDRATGDVLVFPHILRMDQSRILARLRPQWHAPPVWENRRRESLRHDIQLAFRAITNRNPRSTVLHTLNERVRDFLAAAEELDSLSGQDIHVSLTRTVEAASQVGETWPSLETELRKQKIRIPETYTSTLRDFDKVRRYRFVSNRLTTLASSSRLGFLFQSTEIVFLDPYRSHVVHGQERFVHAEIQLAIHHLNRKSATRPRYIGTSKAACYLCDLFLRRQEMFVPSATHGVLYSKWTIPDVADYAQEERDRLRRLVAAMYREIKSINRMARPEYRPFPNQSMLFYTPCISTLTFVPEREVVEQDCGAGVEQVDQMAASDDVDVARRLSPSITLPLLPEGGVCSESQQVADGECTDAINVQKIVEIENIEKIDDLDDLKKPDEMKEPEETKVVEDIDKPGNFKEALNTENVKSINSHLTLEERQDGTSQYTKELKDLNQERAEQKTDPQPNARDFSTANIGLDPKAHASHASRAGSTSAPPKHHASPTPNLTRVSTGIKHRHRRRRRKKLKRRLRKERGGFGSRILSSGRQFFRKLLCLA